MAIRTYLVEGMTCNHCKVRVENAIKSNVGIEDVIADLANGQVRVSGEKIDSLKVKQSVEESGYAFKGEADGHNAKGSEIWLS